MTKPAPDGSARHAHIARQAESRTIPTYCFRDFAQLAHDAGVCDLGQQCLFSDLSGGPWRGHWLARDLCRQLDLSEPEPIQPNLHGKDEVADTYADTVSFLIDAECGGDRNFSTAHDCASRIVARIRSCRISHVFVVAPQDAHIWGAENLHLLRLLVDAARQDNFAVWCLSRSDSMPTPVSDIQWAPLNAPSKYARPRETSSLPGLLHDAWLADAGQSPPYLRLRDGSLLVSPNARGGELDPIRRETLLQCALPDHLRTHLVLGAPAQDVGFLQAAAGRCFAEGGYEVALEILDRVDTRVLHPLQRAAVEAQKQRMAIALMKFERAAQGMLPSEDMPDAVKASLYQSKAWGLVMTGDAHQANAYFERARRHFDSRHAPRLALYLLNITALARLRSGDIGGALALEDEIEWRLQDSCKHDWHLTYINCLNLARIHKKLGAFDHAERYYRRAFYVTSSARSDSDLLYMNLCQAQMDELRGNTNAALSHWLRATIHWLSDPLPEALAPRVAQAVLGKPLNDRGADVEQISAALNEALSMAASRQGIPFTPVEHAVAFAKLTRQGQADVCVANDGWTLGLSWHEIAPPPFVGTQYGALKRTVVGVLAACVPEIDFSDVRGLLADTRCGNALPATVREACWSCWRYDVRELIRDGQHYRIPDTDDFIAKFVVQLSGAIHSMASSSQHVRITFKRYLAPIELDGDERAVVDCLDTPRTIAQLARLLGHAPHDCASVIRALEDKRVVVVG